MPLDKSLLRDARRLLQGERVLQMAAFDPAKEHRDLYSIFRDYLKHEDDLNNNRLSWNVTIQGFLFAAYTFSLQKIGDMRLGWLNPNVDGQRIRALKIFHTFFDLHLLLAALALAGIIVNVFVYLSIKAARIAIDELESRWTELYPSYSRVKFDWWSWLRKYLQGQDTANHGGWALARARL